MTNGLALGDWRAQGKSFRRENNSVMRNGFWRKRLPSRPACSPTAASTRSPVMKMKIGRGPERAARFSLNAIVKIESGDHDSGAGLEIQIAQNHVIGISIGKVQRLFGRSGAVHRTSAGAEGIGHQFEDAFLVVDNQDFLPRERSGRRLRRIPRGQHSPAARAVRHRDGLRADRQGDSENGAAIGQRLRGNISVVFANNRHADAEAEPGTAAGALRGKERIENARQEFATDAHAIVLEGDENALADNAQTNPQRATFAHFVDGLLGIHDEIQEYLRELIGIPQYGGEIGRAARST